MEALAEILTRVKAIENKLNCIYSKFFTVKEASEYLRISESKLRKLIGAGKIPINRIDGKILLNRRALDYLILTGSAKPNKRQREAVECLI
ncbi:helix-turn-helix domain-containing protein [bacterium]|nr:helix-turn-helix domain-containing protein [bacterium]